VGIFISSGRRLRAAGRAFALVCAPLLLAACAANAYAGIPFGPGAAAPELQALARRAQAGDKQAQLELGIRYEEGRDVPVDLGRAERLYSIAANDSGGTRLIFVPSSRPGGSGATVPLNGGPLVAGLPAARARLEALQASGRRRHSGDRSE